MGMENPMSVLSWSLTKIEELALENPAVLREEIPKMCHADMSWALEALGDADQSPETRKLLVSCLSHHSPLVREGAMIGLWLMMDDELSAIIETMSTEDQSEGVRLTAKDLVEEYAAMGPCRPAVPQELLDEIADLDNVALQYAAEFISADDED